MSQKPVFYCARCHTTRPPLFATRTYTCVMCGKARSIDEYKLEMAKLREEGPSKPKVYSGPAWRPEPEDPEQAKEREERRKAEAKEREERRKAEAKAREERRLAEEKEREEREAAAKAAKAKAAKAPPKLTLVKDEPKPVEAKKAAPPKPAPAKPEPAPAKQAEAKKPAPAAAKAAPPKKAAPKAAAVGTDPCAWKDCDKPARKASKYCSRACSNKNARWRHSQRRKEG